MAQRRMFSKSITTSDLFVDMPLSAQLLYFHLGMEADDDGFIGNAKMLSRAYGTNNDDLKLLFVKGFLLQFGNGVSVIKDWNVNNQIRKDRHKETIYVQEKAMLTVDNTGSYTFGNQMATSWQPNGNQMATKDRLVETSLVEVSKTIVEQDFVFPDYLTEKSINSIEKGSPLNYERRIPIAYLNQVTGKNYKYVEKTIKLVNARLSEGYTIDDFKTVIDVKFAEWASTDMEKYLRPETLFSNKFDGYLNQQPAKLTEIKDRYSEFDSTLPF